MSRISGIYFPPLLLHPFIVAENTLRVSTHTIIHKKLLFLQGSGISSDAGAMTCVCVCVILCVCVCKQFAWFQNAIKERLEQIMCWTEVTNTHMLNLRIKAERGGRAINPVIKEYRCVCNKEHNIVCIFVSI